MQYDLYKERRQTFVATLKDQYPAHAGVLLFAGFEPACGRFQQESSFFYLTGLQEPGIALWLDADGTSTVFVPQFSGNRAAWVTTEVDYAAYGIDRVEFLGDAVAGYSQSAYFSKEAFSHLIERMKGIVAAKKTILTIAPSRPGPYEQQLFVLERLNSFVAGLLAAVHDISPVIAAMRQKKDKHELEQLYRAVDITLMGHEAAAALIAPMVAEQEVQAAVEYVFTAAEASVAFPSIVGGGKNGTVLHYTQNNAMLQANDLVVVDIGASYGHYCGDITRTYPVSGSFTERQREIYEIVLETQRYIESIAAPGMWLSNADHKEESLNHLAKEFLREQGYDQYFIHSIGHYLGLDVHDVGDYSKPLAVGDVITIEPGIYIPEEGIGVRIEDNYWIVEDGIICLSEQLPKSPDDIVAMMKSARKGI